MACGAGCHSQFRASWSQNRGQFPGPRDQKQPLVQASLGGHHLGRQVVANEMHDVARVVESELQQLLRRVARTDDVPGKVDVPRRDRNLQPIALRQLGLLLQRSDHLANLFEMRRIGLLQLFQSMLCA